MGYILKTKEGGKVSVSSTEKKKKAPARKTLKEYKLKIGADGGISLFPVEKSPAKKPAKKPATKKAGKKPAPAKKPATKKAGKKKR